MSAYFRYKRLADFGWSNTEIAALFGVQPRSVHSVLSRDDRPRRSNRNRGATTLQPATVVSCQFCDRALIGYRRKTCHDCDLERKRHRARAAYAKRNGHRSVSPVAANLGLPKEEISS